MSLIPDRLGPKLSLFLLGMFAVLGLAAAALIVFGFARTQDDATTSSREGLEAEGRRSLSSMAGLQAAYGQAQLERTAGLARQASLYVAGEGPAAARTSASAPLLRAAPDGTQYSDATGQVTQLILPAGAEIDAGVRRDIAESGVLDALMPVLLADVQDAALSESFDATSMYYRSTRNLVRVYPPRDAAAAGAPFTTSKVDVGAAGPEANPGRGIVWTAPYAGEGGAPLLTALAPVYVGEEYRGVVAVDLSLERLAQQIDLLKPTPGGFAFYIDREGGLLETASAAAVEAAIADGGDEGVAPVMAAMRAGQTGVLEAEMAGEEMFVAFTPLQGVGGAFALAAPVDEITLQAAEVDAAINDGGRETLVFALLAMAVVSALALAAAGWLNQRLVLKPVSELVEGTRALAAGDHSRTIPVRSRDELGTLASTFNDMTGVLRERTDALAEREEQYRSVFEATSDGLIITEIESGVIAQVNEAMCAMHGYAHEEMLRLHPTAFIHPDDHHLFVDYITTVSAGGEYRCRARDVRKDGSVFHVDVMGTPVTYNGKQHVLGIVRDVTAQVEAEHLLEDRVRSRTRDLASMLKVSTGIAEAIDTKSVAHAILVELADVAEYTGATLAIVEGDDLVIVDSWGPFSEEVVGGPTARFPRRVIPRDFWRVMESGAPVVIDDVRDDSALAASYRRVFAPFLELASFRTIRSWIAMPLTRQGTIVGMLTASHDDVGRFTEERTRLIAGAASQAAVAMENAQLFDETRERTRELQTLLSVSRNVASTLELRPLMQLVLEEVHSVAEFERASVLFLDERLRALRVMNVMRAGDTPEHIGAPPDTLFPVDDAAEFWVEFNANRPVIIDDVRADTPFAEVYRRAAAPRTDPALETVRSWMAVPLQAKSKVIGIIALTTRKPAAYSERQAGLLIGIASQAAVAIENARLYEQAEERDRESAALLQISNSVTSTLELGQVVRVILAQLGTVVDYTGSSVVVVNDEGDLEVLSSRLTSPPNAPDGRGMRFRLSRSSTVWRRLEQHEPVIIDDVRGDTIEAEEYRTTIGEEGMRSPLFSSIRSWMAVPLAAKNHLIGMLTMSRTEPGYFTEKHARIAAAVGQQASVAIENARLYERGERRTEELGTLLDVSRNVASTLELQPLLQVTLEQLRRVAPYDGATFFILHGSKLRAEAYVTQLDADLDTTTIGLEIPVRDEPLWERVAAGTTVIIDDVYDEDDEAAGEYRAVAGPLLKTRFRRVKSWLGLPLMLGDRPIGLLALSGHTTGVFTAEHERLARGVADRAALAIENARLYEEAASRTRELAALLDVSKGVASTLDRGPLVATILERLSEIIEYNGASILLRNGDELEIVDYDRTAPIASTALQVPMRFPIRAMEPLWSRMLEGKPLIVGDFWHDAAAGSALRGAVGDLADGPLRHVRAMLAVPLMVHDRVIGTLSLSHGTPGYFTDAHASVARAVADQAAVALENARLYEETTQRARETEALLRADAQLFRSLSLDEVFQALCDVAVDVLAADKCMVTTIEDAQGRYVVRASRGIADSSIAKMLEIRRNRPRAALGTMTEPIINTDVRAAIPEMLPVFEAEGIVSTIDVPVRIEGRVRGDFVVVYTRAHTPSAEELRLFQALADRASLALRNAESFEQSQQIASLEERQRLARELHDSVSQALYGIALGARTARTQLDRDPAKAVEPVEYVLSLAEAGLAEMRALIFELRPESLESEGLVAAIEKHVASTRARYGLEVEARLGAEPDVRLEVKEALYRVTQEALHNIVKHAQARHVDVVLGQDGGDLTLEVRDDGRGFDTAASYPGHVGLHSMRERVEKLSGAIAIESAPGAGSAVRVRVPLNGARA